MRTRACWIILRCLFFGRLNCILIRLYIHLFLISCGFTRLHKCHTIKFAHNTQTQTKRITKCLQTLYQLPYNFESPKRQKSRQFLFTYRNAVKLKMKNTNTHLHLHLLSIIYVSKWYTYPPHINITLYDTITKRKYCNNNPSNLFVILFFFCKKLFLF